MNSCPTCGSRKGWYQKATWRSEVLGDWETMETLSPHMTVTWISTIVRCIDCDKGISLKHLEQMHAEEQDHGR